MAELNLKQITDKLNSEFTGDVRKLVFWYDANAEFQEDIDTIELENAKVAHLALSRIDIDLDDGVKVNYEKVQTASDGKKMQILAKI